MNYGPYCMHICEGRCLEPQTKSKRENCEMRDGEDEDLESRKLRFHVNRRQHAKTLNMDHRVLNLGPTFARQAPCILCILLTREL